MHFLRAIATILLLSTPLHAQDAHVPEGFDSFEAYEVAMYARIDELAAQKGLNIDFVHQDRAELRAEYETARNRNDKAGMAEARAMQAYVIRFALEQLSK